MTEPARHTGDIPVNQAVILSEEQSNPAPGGATLRTSVCDNKYVLQIKRISSHSNPVVLRVFTKDADDEGFSAVINSFSFNTISTSSFTTVLLYDEDSNEICFDADDNIAFIQPFYFSEEIEFDVRLYNVSGSLPTTSENIFWDDGERYYYSLYPAASGSCENQNPDYCCDYNFEAQSVASSIGDMQFAFVWDGGGGVYTLSVPPTDSDSHNSTNCGPILVSWKPEDDHVTSNGYGALEFDCDNAEYEWIIGDTYGYHGVLLDPNGRMCFLEYCLADINFLHAYLG